MDTRVLLIGNAKSFMVISIANELRSCGFEVIQAEPRVEAIESIENRPSVFLFYVEGPEDMKDVFVCIKEKVMEDDVSVSIIGSHNDIMKIINNVPRERISAVFERPVNVKELGRHMIEAVAKEDERLSKKRILLISGDGTLLRNVKSVLSENYRVFMVYSGPAAIALLAKNKMDLILIDYEMPVISGPKVLEMLKREYYAAGIPTMFLTLKYNTQNGGFLFKGMSPAELLAAIDGYFKKS